MVLSNVFYNSFAYFPNILMQMGLRSNHRIQFRIYPSSKPVANWAAVPFRFVGEIR